MKRLIFVSVGVFFALAMAAQNVFAQVGEREINGGVLNGKAIVLAKPDYPPAAKAIAARGAVNVRIVIDEKGSVVSASAVSGHPLLRSAAERAARQSRFTPTLLSGKPVKVAGVLVYNFTGKDAADESGISAGVVNGRAKVLPQPEYPKDLKKAVAEGTVTVEIVIDEQGKVVSAAAVSGDSRLREISEKAARRAEFPPTLLRGVPIRVRGVLVYNFSADGDEPPLGKVLSAPDAEFPPAAEAVGARGAVRVQVTIDEKGEVVFARAVSGHALLRSAAEKAALRAKFASTVLDGKEVKVTRVLIYDFAGDSGSLIEYSAEKP